MGASHLMELRRAFSLKTFLRIPLQPSQPENPLNSTLTLPTLTTSPKGANTTLLQEELSHMPKMGTMTSSGSFHMKAILFKSTSTATRPEPLTDLSSSLVDLECLTALELNSLQLAMPSQTARLWPTMLLRKPPV